MTVVDVFVVETGKCGKKDDDSHVPCTGMTLLSVVCRTVMVD